MSDNMNNEEKTNEYQEVQIQTVEIENGEIKPVEVPEVNNNNSNGTGKKNSKLTILLLALLTICLIGGTYAVVQNVNVTFQTKSFEIGSVEVALKTYTVNNYNQLVELGANQNFNIKDTISYVPMFRRTEDSGECYVRLLVKIDYGVSEAWLTVNDIVNLNPDLEYAEDGYFYYVNKLGTTDVKAFDEIKLPPDIAHSTNLVITTKLEAIQAKNVEPDFTILTGNGPWREFSYTDIIEKVSTTN